jgi:DNA-binding response OmpR family regulator
MKQRVLIVDDDSSVRESIQKVLRGAGYEVKTASDDKEALAQFRPDQIDLVLLDLNLPTRGGWDVFERITTMQPTLPVIIVTGLPDKFETAIAAGVGALMEKPFEVSVLLKTMHELLAEPAEARLHGMCGFAKNLKYVPPAALPMRKNYRRSR